MYKVKKHVNLTFHVSTSHTSQCEMNCGLLILEHTLINPFQDLTSFYAINEMFNETFPLCLAFIVDTKSYILLY